MKPADRQRFAPYVRQLADRLGLKDWQFEVRPDPPRDTAHDASVVCVYGQKHALIRLGDGFLVDSPEGQRATLVHELLHCHFNAAGSLAEEELEGGMMREFRRHLEYGVDAVSLVLAPHLPAPLEGIMKRQGK